MYFQFLYEELCESYKNWDELVRKQFLYEELCEPKVRKQFFN